MQTVCNCNTSCPAFCMRVANFHSVPGYRYGKSLIPISEADEKQMKFEAARSLSLLGFTKMECVKQHQCVGSSVQVLVANPDDQVRV